MREVLYKVFVQEEYFSSKRKDEEPPCKEKLTRKKALSILKDCIKNRETCYLVADFGGYFVGTENLRDLNGIIILEKVINGVLQEMPKYNLVSAMSANELEEKSRSEENYKMHLTPKELVWEIRKSSDKFFRFGTSDINSVSKYFSHTINVDKLDPEYKVKEFYELI